MKTFIKVTILLVSLVITFASCSKDDVAQEYNHPEVIVGTWFQHGGESYIKFESNGKYNKVDKSKRPFRSSNGDWGQKGKYVYLIQYNHIIDSLEIQSYSQLKDSKSNYYTR